MRWVKQIIEDITYNLFQKVSANETRCFMCHVFSHWLRPCAAYIEKSVVWVVCFTSELPHVTIVIYIIWHFFPVVPVVYHITSLSFQYQGCTKLKSAWGLNFNINFRPDIHTILMLSGKAQNVHFILSNTYIGLKMRTDFYFTTLKWIRKLSFDDHYEQWLLLIAKGTLQNNLIKESCKKEQNPGSCMIEKESFKSQTINVKFDLL